MPTLEDAELDYKDINSLITEIAPDGDVILVVGTEGKKLRVLSTILRQASKYFRNLLGPHFAEGQGLDENYPKEILMHDDFAAAVEIICNLAHYRNNKVPVQLEPLEMFQLAITADKFDCINVVMHACIPWLSPDSTKELAGLGYLMTAAYVLDDVSAFGKITLEMMKRHKESYLDLAAPAMGIMEWIPWQVLYLLEEGRSQLRIKLLQIISINSTDAGLFEGGSCSCAWASRWHLAYTDVLRGERLQPEPLSERTISGVITKLETMRDPRLPATSSRCGDRWHREPEYRASRTDMLSHNIETVKGLCIDCVRSFGLEERIACRLDHQSNV